MKTIRTNSSQIKIEEILRGIAQLKVTDLEGFAKQVTAILQKKKAPLLEQKEKILIEKLLNGGPSEKFRKRQRFLLKKSVEGTITPKEQEEALTMIPISSKWDLERIKLMQELAKLRYTTLEEVRISLNITPPEEVYA